MFVCSHLSYFEGEAEGIEDEIIEENFYTGTEDEIGRLVVTEQDALAAGETQDEQEVPELNALALNLTEQPDCLLEPRISKRSNLGLNGIHLDEELEDEGSKDGM